MTRRAFLGAAASVAAGAPTLLSAAAGRAAPSNRIALGLIGIGNQGGQHLTALLGNPDVQVVAVCEVDSARREKSRQLVDERYGQYRSCASYADFRELLAQPGIDAVFITTPDHWHAIPVIEAARQGKDIYCEKPLSLTVAEGQAMVAAVQRYGVVLQVGCQERSGRNARWACEMVRNGRLGKLNRIVIGLPPHEHPDVGLQPEMPVPPELDYDFWLGPAPWAPYTKYRCHYCFRFISDYSGGEITNRGAHVGDLALWGAGPLLRGPVEIEGRGTFYNGGLFNTARTYYIEFRYANGIEMIVDSNLPRGVRFEGDKGWINVEIHGAALTASDPTILKQVIEPGEIRLHESLNHREDFFRGVRTHGPVIANVVEAHRTATWCQLCNIAVVLSRKLRWDPDREVFLNDPEANRMLARPMRGAWRL